MTKTSYLFAGLTVAFASCFAANLAYAQSAHTWASSSRSGTACTRAVPCDYGTPYGATSAGGVLSLLDPIDWFSTTFITKSLTIRAEYVDAGATKRRPRDFGFLSMLVRTT
jgi:hypothetical protein